MSDDNITYETREISCPRVGSYKVHIQGSLTKCQLVVLTVHDLGCNHKMWEHFLRHTSMEEVVKRTSFIHVDVPGQDEDAEDLPEDYKFPSMQFLGEDLVCVLDQLQVKQVLCLGEGAGANILARFAMAVPQRVLGSVLIHCTGTSAGLMESIKDKMISWKLDHQGMNTMAEAYLVLHRFGSFDKASSKEEVVQVVDNFIESLRCKINPHNLKRFVQAFMKRSTLADPDHLKKITETDLLLVTGTLASFNHTVHTLYGHFALAFKEKKTNKKVELLTIDGVANVLEEKPERLAEALIYFCQGLNCLPSISMPRVRGNSQCEVGEVKLTKQRSMSMEEYDKPLGIYSSSPSRRALSTSPPNDSVLSTSPKAESNMSTSPPKN